MTLVIILDMNGRTQSWWWFCVGATVPVRCRAVALHSACEHEVAEVVLYESSGFLHVVAEASNRGILGVLHALQ